MKLLAPPLLLAAALASQDTPTAPAVATGAWQLELCLPTATRLRVARGVLDIAARPPGTATLRLETELPDVALSNVALSAATPKTGEIELSGRHAGESLRLTGRWTRGRWTGACVWGERTLGWTATRGRIAAARTPIAPPDEDLDRDALQALLDAALATNTDALLVAQGSRIVLDETFGMAPRPLPLMSITKSIVGLVVGHLIDQGAISSVDAPLAAFFPELEDKDQGAITLRHLLSHTSGLQAKPTTEDVYAQRDVVQFALDAPLTDPPGTAFFYNNRAVNLLAGVVRRAAKQPLDRYALDHLFRPLGMERVRWRRDPAGNPMVMSGLSMTAAELLAFGQLLLRDGRHDGEALLSKRWTELSTRPSQGLEPRHGLLWWLLYEGNDPSTGAPPIGYCATGYRGQFLVVLPAKDIVAVRQIHPTSHRVPADSFRPFIALLRRL